MMTANRSIINSLRISSGFGLIEVMVAMFILAVGILGAGALQTVGMQSTQGAYYRTQAMFIASDMVDRMRANRKALSSYAGVNTSGTPRTDPNCITSASGCTPTQIADSDVIAWTALFNSTPAVFPANGQGTVVSNGGNSYTITVNWSENEWTQNSRALGNKSYVLNVNFDTN